MVTSIIIFASVLFSALIVSRTIDGVLSPGEFIFSLVAAGTITYFVNRSVVWWVFILVLTFFTVCCAHSAVSCYHANSKVGALFALLMMVGCIVVAFRCEGNVVATSEWSMWMIKALPYLLILFALFGFMKNPGGVRTLSFLLALALIITAIPFGNLFNKAKDAGAETGSVTTNVDTTTKSSSWIHFYNDDVQGNLDGVEGNNKEFGPNPIKEGWTVDNYVKDQAERFSVDPALLTITMATYDQSIGSDTTGRFYDSIRYDWSRALGECTLAMAADEDLFVKQHNRFVKDISDNYKVEYVLMNDEQLRKELGYVVQDMAYMRPGDSYDDGIPRVVICYSDLESRTGLFLVWKITVKVGEKPHYLVFRINCGYQPVNVAEMFNIVPLDPNDPWIDGGGMPPGENPPTHGKDPSKGPEVGKNDDPTAGESTNNGVGATQSSKDTSTSTTSYSSYDGYKKETEEKNTQKTGDDSNKPSAPSPTGAKVDNNAGSGSGGINVPTTAPSEDKTADNTPISSESDGPFDGPPDD